MNALAADAAALGISIEGGIAEAAPCLVWPENMPAVRVFLDMGTQWTWVAVAGLGGGQVFRTGLRLDALPVVAAAHGIPITPDLLAALRVLEAETIDLTAK